MFNRISVKISRFLSRFQDFWQDFKISGQILRFQARFQRFQDFRQDFRDFKISGKISKRFQDLNKDFKISIRFPKDFKDFVCECTRFQGVADPSRKTSISFLSNAHHNVLYSTRANEAIKKQEVQLLCVSK